MPITKSAIKRMRQNIKRHRRNLGLKDGAKSEVKALRAAIAEGNQKLIAERLAAAQSKLDKVAQAGVIHKNKVSRQKSQLVKDVKAGAARAARSKTVAKDTAVKPTESKPAETKPSVDSEPEAKE